MRNMLWLIVLVFFVASTTAQQPNDVQFPIKFNPAMQPSLKNTGKNVRNVASRKKEDQKEKKKIKEKERPVGAPPPPPGDGATPPMPSDDEPQRPAGADETVKIEAKHTKKISKNAKVHLDFPDTDLLAVIKYFSEVTGRNFIVQERLAKAKITIMSPVPVTIDEAWRTFLTLLSVNNISVVQSGKFLVIMNEKETISQGISVVKEDNIPNVFKMVATVLKFKYVTAQDIEKVIKIFRDKGGESLIFDDKTIILVDYAANIKKILELTRDLDMPEDADTARLHFVNLSYIAPSDAKKLIDDIFKDFLKKGGGKKKNSPDTPVLSGVADDKKEPKEPAPETKETSSEEDLEGAISSMYVQIVADDRNEQLIVIANKTTYELVLEVVKRVDREIEGEGEIHVYKLQNAKAKDLVNTLNTLVKSSKSKGKNQAKDASEVFEGEVNISANESTNSLVVVSSLRDFRNLKKVIEQLDVRRKQVFVEAVIMEVKVSENLEYGTSFAAGGFETTIGDEKVPVFFGKAFSTPTPGLVAGLLGPVLSGTETMGAGLSPVAGIPSLGILWNALKNDSNVNVMSTPHILTTDNEEAEIVVGDTIPFPSGNIISGTAGSQITYKREDVALKLKIKPQINESGYMTLQVDQEVTELGPMTDYGFTTSKRAAKTIINAEDQQTVVIGGLMKDIVTEGDSKIPILGDIPVLGALFKYTKNKKEKVNLLIILTPHIVEGKDDFERIYKRKMQERDEFAKKFYGSIKDYERSVTLAKKRGVLLTMAHLMDQDRRREEEEKERMRYRKQDRALLVGPDGEQREIDLKQSLDAPDDISLDGPSPERDAPQIEEVPLPREGSAPAVEEE